MGNYVRNNKETLEFDGDTITVSLKQIKRIHALELFPMLAKMGEQFNKGAVTANMEMTSENIKPASELVNYVAEIIMEEGYIGSIRGMFIEGIEVDVKDPAVLKEILSNFYFFGFVMQIVTLLMKNCSFGKEVEKKLSSTSTEESMASG